MKLPLLLLLLLSYCSALLLSIASFAQIPGAKLEWAKHNSGPAYNGTWDVAVSDSGFVYVAGYFQDTVDFDPGPDTLKLISAGDRDIFVQKLSPAGDLVWVKRIGSTGLDHSYAVAVDRSGNVYCTGSFVGTVDFNPGTAINNLVSNGNNQDVFVLKLTAAGNYAWAYKMGGTNSDEGYGIAVDAAANVYVTGGFIGTVDFNPGSGTANLVSNGNLFHDIFIQKVTTAGAYVWAKRIGGTEFDVAYGIALDDSSNVYTTGYFGVFADFDPGTGTDTLFAAPSRDVFILKLTSAGNYVWAKQLDGSLFLSQGRGIDVDTSHNVYVTGYFPATVDFDPGTDTFYMTPAVANATDPFIVKLDINGNFRWAKQLMGTTRNQGMSIAVDKESSVYTTGYFSLMVDFDPGPDTLNIRPVNGAWDVYVHKLDSAGQFVWVKTIGKTGQDQGQAIAVDTLGNIYIGGTFGLTADFDPTLAGTFDITSAGNTDAFVTKWSQCTGTASRIDTVVCYSFTAASGNIYDSTGIYTEAYLNANGCDSIVTLNVTINDTTYQTIADTACGSYTLNGETYDTSGIYLQLHTNATGCDSILTLELVINNTEVLVTQVGDTLISGNSDATYHWLDCADYSPIVDATDSLFVPLETGNYALAITENGCTDTSACFNIVINGIDDGLFGQDFQVYPNPTTGSVVIDLGSFHNYLQVKVLTLTGQTLSIWECSACSEMELQINAPGGMYLIELNSTQGKRVLKVIKE